MTEEEFDECETLEDECWADDSEECWDIYADLCEFEEE